MGCYCWERARWALLSKLSRLFPVPDFMSLKTWSIHLNITLGLWCAIQCPAVVSDMCSPPIGGQPGQPGGRLKQMVWARLRGTLCWCGDLGLVGSSPSCWPPGGQAGCGQGGGNASHLPARPASRQLRTKLSAAGDPAVCRLLHEYRDGASVHEFCINPGQFYGETAAALLLVSVGGHGSL